MTTEIVRATPATSLPDMVRYAEHLANANLLPGQYRKQPANVLYAMEYGRTLGITPIAAITGIHVIEGKPSASAALIGALVRQAGHKLRVTGNSQLATAQIIRSDDPDFVYEVTWELKRNERGNPNAEDAKLLNKEVWQKYGASMLKSRAISQVARDACEEVLFGLHYTPEELGAYIDQDGQPVDAPVQPLRAVQSDVQPEAPSSARIVRAAEVAIKASDATSLEDWRGLWAEAGRDGLLDVAIVDPEGTEQLLLGIYLTRRGEELKQAPAVPGKVVDAELVEDDPHAAAVDELRAAALAAGVAGTLEDDFAQSYGMTIAAAPVDKIREMAGLLRGAA